MIVHSLKFVGSKIIVLFVLNQIRRKMCNLGFFVTKKGNFQIKDLRESLHKDKENKGSKSYWRRH